jgi:hypothetical protein
MSDALSITIRRQLRRYLSGAMTLRQFTKWLAARLVVVEKQATAANLAHEIYIRISEYTNGDWTEDELKRLLAPLVTTYVISWPATGVPTQTGTSTASTRTDLGLPEAIFVGTGFATVSA